MRSPLEGHHAVRLWTVQAIARYHVELVPAALGLQSLLLMDVGGQNVVLTTAHMNHGWFMWIHIVLKWADVLGICENNGGKNYIILKHLEHRLEMTKTILKIPYLVIIRGWEWYFCDSHGGSVHWMWSWPSNLGDEKLIPGPRGFASVVFVSWPE